MPSQTTCLVCQSSQLKFLFKAKAHLIHRCTECGFCLVGDPPDDDQIGALYQRLHIDHQRFRDQRAADRENLSRLEFVKRQLAPGSTLLDAGCATGDFLGLARQQFTVHGTDISQGAVDMVGQRFPELRDRLVCGRLEDNVLGDQTFDAICLWDVIEHVRDPAFVTQTLLNRLKPGGLLFLSTPDIGSMMARVMGRHWAFMIPPLHLGYFTRASAMRLLHQQLGCEITAAQTRGKWTSVAFLFYKLGQIHPLFAPAWLMSWLSGSAVGHLNIYVPTRDIMYLAARKPGPTT